jgi:hypothetical protein
MNALTAPLNLLFFERGENRLVTNAPELCDRLRPAYNTWLFREPDDLDFCTQIRAVHWADLIVLKMGSHMEYAGIGARRGSALIVIYAYPNIMNKFESIRTAFMPGLRLLDLPTFSDSPVDFGSIRWNSDYTGMDAGQINDLLAQCQLVSFGTIMMPGLHHCGWLLAHNNTFVDLLTLQPYVEAAVREVQSGDFNASNPCYSSGLLCEPPGVVQSCRADRQCKFAMQILDVAFIKRSITHASISFVPSSETWFAEEREMRLRHSRQLQQRNLLHDRAARPKATSSSIELRRVMEKLALNNSDLSSVQAACAFFERVGQPRDASRCRHYLEQVVTETHRWQHRG